MAKCRCGLPKWTTVTVMGIPFLMCARCGGGLPKAVVEQTHTQRELDALQKPKPKPKPWKRELHDIVEKIWEERHGNRR